MQRVMHWLDRWVELTTLPTDSAEERLQKRILILAATLTTPFLLGIGLLYLAYSETTAGLLYSFFVGYIWLNLGLLVFYHRNHRTAFWAISSLALPTHLLVALSLGDFIQSGAIVLWGFAFPTVTGLVFVSFRKTIPFFIGLAVNIIVTTLAQPYLRASNNLPPALVLFIFASNLILQAGFIYSIFGYFVFQRDTAYRLLHVEQNKSEALLLNILPQEIAAILKDDQRTIADHFDSVSILFADVVGFTPLSASMTAIELVELLNDIFSHFDTLVEKYDLEKIKTIGDCYMVASGVPSPRPDHAQALVQMALEMQTHVAHHEIRGRRINFRIGINSGDVVAGVIGRKKFIYDLWGDAVNTASRMESHGAGGTVQITDATYTLIKDDFVCEPRGIMTIKGKGDMAVWTVIQAK
jgi:adenylate cyclase